MKKLVGVAVLSALWLGCEKEEEKDELKPAPSLFASADLEAGTTKVVPAEEITGRIVSSSEFRYQGGGALLTQDTDEACMDEIWNTVRVQADKVNLTIAADVDALACSGSDTSEDSEYEVAAARLRMLLYVGCPESDLRGYNGMTMQQFSETSELVCATQSESQFLMNFEFTMSLRGEVEVQSGVTLPVELDMRSLSATQTETGGPCVTTKVADGWAWADACRSYNKFWYARARAGEVTLPMEGESDYMRLAYKSIVEAEDDALWFASGSFDVVVNDWSGTVTYSSPTTPPTYTLTNGTTNVTGSFSEAAMRLTAPRAAQMRAAMERAVKAARGG